MMDASTSFNIFKLLLYLALIISFQHSHPHETNLQEDSSVRKHLRR